MFVFQAALQFELWTGKKAPVEVMRQSALTALKS
jgi:shikimate 5-dehydrogenase